jgi:NAD(P)-dependent dehydrogenase (short-subunit alcohol dehydrogenase family)
MPSGNRSESGRLAGKVALVTGAASGIGEAIVKRFRAEQAQVVAVGLQDARLKTLADQSQCRWFACDVTKEDEVRNVVDHALEYNGRLDVVVNAAGAMYADDVAEIEDDQWARMLDINLTGTMRVCRAALPAMLRQKAGAFVNVSSVAAFNASPGSASYAASKGGLIAFTRALANKYGQDGIRANCLCPGWVRTPMSEMEMLAAAKANGTSMEAEFEQLTSRIALRRIADPEELAACALFLASDDASFVTGTALVADGGARSSAASRAN